MSCKNDEKARQGHLGALPFLPKPLTRRQARHPLPMLPDTIWAGVIVTAALRPLAGLIVRASFPSC